MNPFEQSASLFSEQMRRVRERLEARNNVRNNVPEPKSPRQRLRWLVTIPALATLCAAAAEVYWAWLFVIEATGGLTLHWDIAGASGAPGHNDWGAAFSTNAPVLIGLVIATVPIVMWSMIWLPAQMEARGTGAWRRITMIIAGLLCNALVIVSGTVVMNGNRQEHVRADLVKEQSAAASRESLAVLKAQAQGELQTMMDNRNAYLAQAASVGAVEWQKSYIDTLAPTDPQKERITRALGAARAADAKRAQIDALTLKIATAAPEAATAANVQDNVGAGMNTFAQYADAYRPPFVALTCTLIGILGAFWLVGLMKEEAAEDEPADVLAIEDHTADAPLPTQPYEAAKEKKERVWDPDEGVWRVKRKSVWAKVPTKKINKKVAGKPDETLYEAQAKSPKLNDYEEFADGSDQANGAGPADDERASDVSERPSEVAVLSERSNEANGAFVDHDSLTPSEPEEIEDGDGSRAEGGNEPTVGAPAAGDDDLAATQEDASGYDRGRVVRAEEKSSEQAESADEQENAPATPDSPLQIITETVSEEEFAREYEAGRVTRDGWAIPDPEQAVELEDDAPKYPALPAPSHEMAK